MITLPPAIVSESPACPLAGFDVPRLLACIVAVEGHRWTDPGGALAITRGVWRDRSRLPYSYASRPQYAYPVAEEHLRWLVRQLRRNGHPVTTYTLAAAWNWGLTGYSRRPWRGANSYPSRVAALYEHE